MFGVNAANPKNPHDSCLIGAKGGVCTKGDCGDNSASVYDLVKDLGLLRAEMDGEYLLSAEVGKFPIQAKETRRLWRQLSFTMQKALAHRTIHYIARQ